jgi:hypothetical protein
MRPASLSAPLLLLLVTHCKDVELTPEDTTSASTAATTDTSTASACPGPGLPGCECTTDKKCLEGLKCLVSLNLCIDPSDLSTTGASGASGDEPTTGPECSFGLEGCLCTPGGVCLVGLECIDGLCQPSPPATTGSEPPPGETTEGAVCVADYAPCDSQRNCCDESQHCLDFTGTNGDGILCAPECTAHTACPSKCCGHVQDLQLHVCYSAPCDDLCADTCPFAGDGVCDDGGLWSEYALCEYGTDCADCGSRASSDAPWLE